MQPIRHKSLLFLICLCLTGHAAGAAEGTRGQARALNITNNTDNSEAESAGLGHHARETLCANQIAMCAVSCQNNIRANLCDIETLNWLCSCQNHSKRVFRTWQFPVPFQLCRKELELCLDSCVSTQQAAIEQEINQRHKQPPPSSSTSENYQKRMNVYPSSDLETMDEFQLVRQSAKAQAAFFSRLGKQTVNTKNKKEGHKQIRSHGEKSMRAKRGSDPSKPPEPGQVRSNNKVRAKTKGAQWVQVNNVGKVKEDPDSEIEEAEAKDKGERTRAMVTVGPAIDRDPTCVHQCQATFACGTPAAPEYSGLDQFLANLRKSDSEPGGSRTESMSGGAPDASMNGVVIGSAVLASLASLSLFV